jgi:hypothetical protein
VLAELWDTIQSRGVDTFYILDNTMRNDRFHTAIQLFALTGMAVVTPYVVLGKYMSYMSIEEQGKWVLSFGGEAFDPKTVTMTMDSSVNAREGEVVDLLKKYMELKRNIVYIEKDDSISFLKTVIDISKNSTYAGFLRNRAPEDPNVIAIQK